jgi:Xaa-Pro aminopeptidase
MKKNFFKNSFGNEILFSKKEYLDRVKKVKLKMSKNNIDVLLVASPANQFYLTGYDGWSFYTPQMVLISYNSIKNYYNRTYKTNCNYKRF